MASPAAVTDAEWSEYKANFKKKYESEAEDQKRRAIYSETKLIVVEHNRKFEAGEVSYKMGLNHFADQTAEERNFRTGLQE